MSATPLPATPATQDAASSARASASAAGRRAHERAQDRSQAFDAHMQDAQRQQPTPPAGTRMRDGVAAAAAPSKPAATTGTGTAAPVPASAASATTTVANADANADDSSTAQSLANDVLQLIDQSTTGHAGHGSAADQADAQPGKPAADVRHAKSDPVSLAQAAAALAQHLPAVAMQPPAGAAATISGKGDVASTGGVPDSLGAQGRPSIVPGPAGTAANAVIANAADGAADSGNADPATTPDSTWQGAAVADAGATAGSSGFHVAVAAAQDSPAATPPAGVDTSVLRGLVDATAVPAPAATGTGSVHALSVNAPVGSSGFARELGQQVTWLSGQDVKQAQIRLNPQNLGPVDIHVSVTHSRVDVSFMVQHPDAVAAVQQSLGQLHQMLGGHGLSLGHATVGQQGTQQQYAERQASVPHGASGAGDDDSTADSSAGGTLERAAIGLVDAFA